MDSQKLKGFECGCIETRERPGTENVENRSDISRDWCNETQKHFNEMYGKGGCSPRAHSKYSKVVHSDFCECRGTGVGCACYSDCICGSGDDQRGGVLAWISQGGQITPHQGNNWPNTFEQFVLFKGYTPTQLYGYQCE
ncbi:hypothetical protein AX774_g1347 [Zancudomyces culisetae]|uniref:Uncharacterized protein n=1 Tax=Zancudomyces culisetae TaxID=1213189 RepID=A0A1R1PVY3_ZANCU|nr:hypothetical protein AX774_g1347 [Zancudomyces culisetae]|eukprot:OMH85127.1 hypothetical protein AX774_g1347 [Zancudomyces culisetae]